MRVVASALAMTLTTTVHVLTVTVRLGQHFGSFPGLCVGPSKDYYYIGPLMFPPLDASMMMDKSHLPGCYVPGLAVLQCPSPEICVNFALSDAPIA